MSRAKEGTPYPMGLSPTYAGREEYDLICRFADSIDEEDIWQRLD